eukprot:TRINITY_DN6031_c1_g3_i2.p1 TRINITY_DN6031_c1_g3~~TRINITY_DN6031_c1_g3_i2.p1  ORF type:complete len:210 (-),score=43.01 TRINITY_DN6031_c1_g3_i2:145-774(-)
MLILVNEFRVRGERQLEIIGYSEVDREGPDIAQQRAEAVHNWFVEHSIPAERMTWSARPPGPRGCRRVDLRLYDDEGSGVAIRQRAGKLMQQLFSKEKAIAHSTSIPESSEPPPPKDGSPTVSIQQIDATEAASGKKGLKLVFTKTGLLASDTALEIGTQAIRLASLSGAWPEMEVPLPFAVEPPSETSAKFSKKAGTLTVTLNAADCT